MAKKVWFGISKKLSLVLLVVALVPFIAALFFRYQIVTALTTEKINQQLSAVNNTLITHVEAWFNISERMLLQNAALADMQSMTFYLQPDVLKTMAKYYDSVTLAFTTDTEGNSVARSDGKELKYYGDQQYIKEVLAGQQFGRQIFIDETSGKPAMVISTGIIDSAEDLVGVLAQVMTLTELSDEITSSRIGRTGLSFLVDERSDVVIHPDEKITRSRVDFINHQALIALKKGQSTTVFDNAAGEKIVAVAQKMAHGYIMVSQQNYAEAYHIIEEEKKRALILLGGTLAVVLMSILLVSRLVTSPISKLTEIADKYSQGQLDLEVTGLNRKDEIGLLSQAIDRLGTSIRLAMNRLQKKQP